MNSISPILADPPEAAHALSSTERVPPVQVHRARRRRVPLAGLLLSAMVAASLPNGSNHPLAWMLWSLAVGMIALATVAAGRRPFASLGRAHRLMCLIGGGLIAASLLQSGLGWFRPATGPAGSLAPAAGIVAAVRLGGLVLFLALVGVVAADRRRSRALLTGIFYLITAHALAALLIQASGGPGAAGSGPYAGFATGLFVSRNAFAALLAMGAVAGAALLTSRRARRGAGPGWLEPATHAVGMAAILAALAATGSRLGLAAGLAGMAAAALLPDGRRGAVWPAMALGAAIAALMALGPAAERMALLREDFASRGLLYEQVREMIADRPLLGFGADTFPLAYLGYHKPPVRADVVWEHAHSTVLTLWAEFGLLAGSLPLAAGLIAAAVLLRRALWQRQAGPQTRAALGALSLAALFAAFDFSLEIQINAIVLVALVGLGLGSHSRRRPAPEDADGDRP